MENVLRDKNENVSSGQLVLPSKSDMEIPSVENLKENHNPRSLLEIASDTSSKFQLDASTPKTSKKNSSFKDVSFNINSGNNDSISYQENIPMNESSSLSFLANGFNNLKIKTDETASDDEDQFLSFHDMSNRLGSQTVSTENLNVKHDNTLVLNKNETADVKIPEDFALKNDILESVKQDNEIVIDKELVEPIEVAEEALKFEEIVQEPLEIAETVKEQPEPVEIVETIKEQPEAVKIVETVKEQPESVEIFDTIKEHLDPVEIVKEPPKLNETFEEVPKLNETIEKQMDLFVSEQNKSVGCDIDEVIKNQVQSEPVEKIELNKTKEENVKEQEIMIPEKEVCEEKMIEDVISEENAEFEDAEEMPQFDVNYDSPNNASGNVTQIMNTFNTSESIKELEKSSNQVAQENPQEVNIQAEQFGNVNKTFDEMELKALPMNTTFEGIECAVQNNSLSMHTTMPLNDSEQHDSHFSSTFNKSNDYMGKSMNKIFDVVM